MRHHASAILACDFFVTITARFRAPYGAGEIVDTTEEQLQIEMEGPRRERAKLCSQPLLV